MESTKKILQRITPQKAVSFFVVGLITGTLIFGVLLPLIIPGWAAGGSSSQFDKPYPLPNRYWSESQEYYVFASGGQQAGIYVYSIPAMKLIAEIPVFTENEAWGWVKEDVEVKELLTNPLTDKTTSKADLRALALSRTGDAYDGKYLFASDMIYPRLAKIDLESFRPREVLWVPNITGGLNDIALDSNTQLLVTTFEHDQYPDEDIRKYLGLDLDIIEGPLVGGFAGIEITEDSQMKNAWQVWTPFQQDAVKVGWGESQDWIITTTYNSERAVETLNMLSNAEDLLFFWSVESIEEAVSNNNFLDHNVPVISWEDLEVYAVKVPSNPSSVDISPSGTYIFSGGKATARVLVFDIHEIESQISNQQFEEEIFGISVLRSSDQSPVALDLGLGPTHVQFDNQGYAYVGSFVDSVVWKIAMGGPYLSLNGASPWELRETISTHYSVVNPLIPGGDTASPYGKYLIAINKLSKNTFLPHGPLQNENHELFYIEGEESALVDQLSVSPESHEAVALPLSLIKENILTVYPPSEEYQEPRVEYDYDNSNVVIYMDVVRSFFDPEWVTVPQNWSVTMHLNSLEQAFDITHGLAINGYDVAVSLDPGQQRTITFEADKPGVYWYYCLWYCSELHKEMRGRMIVIPQEEWTPALEWSNP